ncbi:hypothetical protein F5141DRAFT_1003564, partial [Pisolithus sp. B1]
HFHALVLPPEYKLTIQSQLPTATCCIHNIICLHDPDDVDIPDPDQVDEEDGPLLAPEDGDVGSLQGVPLTTKLQRQMNTIHDAIAEHMWNDYCGEHAQWGLPLIFKQLDWSCM